MRSLFKDLATIRRDHWLMLMMLLVMKIGQFMFLPFLAIFLSVHEHMEPVMIGLIIGAGPLTFGISSLFAGVMVDYYGIKTTISLSLLFSGIVIYFFFYSHATIWLVMMSMLTGLTRSFFDIGSKSYGILEFTNERKKLFFSLRSMFINTAAAIGPILGAYLTTINATLIFKVIGILYVGLSIFSLFILSNQVNKEHFENTGIYASINKVFRNLVSDKALLLLISICIIFWVVYSQLDSTLAQYLSTSLTDGIKIYSLLLAINAIGCATLQMLMMQYTKHINEHVLAATSMIFFAISNLLIASSLQIPLLITAAFMIVLAEIIVMPLNDFLVTKIAPPHLMGSYYGAMGLGTLGLGVGPIIGEFIYQYAGPTQVFMFCGILCLGSVFLYRRLMMIIPAASEALQVSIN